MICIFVVLYLVIGCFFMGAIPDTAGRPTVVMLFLWPIGVPLLIFFWAIDKLFEFGLFVGKRIRENKNRYGRK